MAILIPKPGLKHVKMTSGEMRFAMRLMAKLEDDYHCWFNVPVGRRQLRPDFIVLHPGRGVLVLEVKDWKLSTIRTIDRTSVELLTDRGLKTEANPIDQARSYAIAIKEMLERDPFLVQQEPGRYHGHLLLPWGFGVVLANITRKQFEDAQLDQAIPGDKVICQDEMTESVDSEAFQRSLWGMFNYNFGAVLTLAHVDRVRWHLFPEIRIEQGNLFEPPAVQPDAAQSIAEAVPDIVRLMDLEQEKLSRNLGMGHRVIHGVAGSGKTMILAYRCIQLSQASLGKPILVLCYNKTLAAKLGDLLAQKGAGNNVQVRHFHGWCKEMCSLYQLDIPQDNRPIYEKQVAAVMAGVDAGRVPRAQYAGLLIDEGHDFQPEWFKLVVQMIDPQTNSLLLLYDDAQNIYGNRRKFTWKSVGVEAAGRSTILKVNYRNPVEVLDFAYSFVESYLDGGKSDEEFPLIHPEQGGRHELAPETQRCANHGEEVAHIGNWLQRRAAAGVAYCDMAVLCRFNSQVDKLAADLTQHGIPVSAGYDRSNKKPGFNPSLDTVKILTMHACKGLEFDSVAVPDLGAMPYGKVEVQEEARVLYVALTRATHRLLITHHSDSVFTRRLCDHAIPKSAKVIIECPSCSGRLRVDANKNLKIHCPKCKYNFEMKTGD